MLGKYYVVKYLFKKPSLKSRRKYIIYGIYITLISYVQFLVVVHIKTIDWNETKQLFKTHSIDTFLKNKKFPDTISFYKIINFNIAIILDSQLFWIRHRFAWVLFCIFNDRPYLLFPYFISTYDDTYFIILV